MNEPTREDKERALQSSLYYLCQNQPFYGALLQELTLMYTTKVPTAGIAFNQVRDQFEVYLNPDYFCNLTVDQRTAVLHHEILHLTNRHLFRLPFLTAKEDERKLYNIAGDMAINQYIPHLPAGCVDVKDWKEKGSGGSIQPFPLFQSMETYYEKLKNNQKVNQEMMDGYKQFDVHDWEALDEATKQRMLEEAKKIVKRTIDKTSTSHSSVLDSIKDLLEEIETLSAALGYKSILRRVLKRTVSSTDRESTWKRTNKRYGLAAPGTKLGMLPRLSFYLDSSGSISTTELNLFLDIMSNFLKVGSRECSLSLWHTSLYYKKKYKLRERLDPEEVESGGTDVTCVMEDIRKSRPNLSIILTDGYYDASDVAVTSAVLFIISKGGNKHHPLQHLGQTIMLEGIN